MKGALPIRPGYVSLQNYGQYSTATILVLCVLRPPPTPSSDEEGDYEAAVS